MYESVEQRMARTYLDLLPPFHPATAEATSVAAQEKLYNWMARMYRAIYDNPALLCGALHEDDAFPNRYNRASYGKPALYNWMKSALRKIDVWMAYLLECGRSGAPTTDGLSFAQPVRARRRYAALLAELGIELTPSGLRAEGETELFRAWHWLANREGIDAAGFARCQFDPAFPTLEPVYGALMGDAAAFTDFTGHLLSRGCRRIERAWGPNSLDYVREHASTPTPLGVPMHGDHNHTGVSFDYRPDAAVPQYMIVRIQGMRDLLLRFEEMSATLQCFVWHHAKHCDDCGYCTQTDRSGRRPRLDIEVAYGGEKGRLCPLYPGFTYTFERLDAALSRDVIDLLAFMDE